MPQYNYYQGALDGIWGAKTEKAIKEYQKFNGITPATGSLTQKTCEFLLRELIPNSQGAESQIVPDVPQHNAEQPF